MMLALLFACSSASEDLSNLTPEERAQASISDYVTEQLGEKNEYTPVEFGPIDSLFQSPNMDTANLWVDKSKYYSDLAMEYLGINMDKAMVFTNSSLHYSNMALDYLENYPKIFEGWTIPTRPR